MTDKVSIPVAVTTGHPRSFGFMRVDNAIQNGVDVQVWESPEGDRFFWAGHIRGTWLRITRTRTPGYKPTYYPSILDPNP